MKYAKYIQNTFKLHQIVTLNQIIRKSNYQTSINLIILLSFT